jgi:RNA polymerase sigma factor (sigma-70 family)
MSTSSWNTRLTLLQRAQNPDDEQAWVEFETYYRKFIQMILRQMNLNQNDIDDLLQEILLRIWKKLPELEYDEKRARFRTWMSHLIRNKVIDHFRKVKRLSAKQDMILGEKGNLTAIVSEPDLEEIFKKEWESYIVELAMQRISGHFSERAMQAFQMTMENISYARIGEELGIKENSAIKLKNRVKTRLIKEIQMLKLELEFTNEQ